tara:strand:+ start:469 stop:903 length:435 start_codon:yes stop_codon:yes gene_type:complete
MKTTKDKVYNRLANRKTSLKKQSVKLGLVDELDYEFDYLQEEVGRLSYSVEEWFDEKFDVWFEIGREIYSVYFQNSETFLTPDDLSGDLEKLNTIKEKAEELGIDVNEVYPNWEDHVREIQYLQELDQKFVMQQQQFRDESKSV